MAYPLLTRDEAQTQIENTLKTLRDRQERINRNETDMEDCFVSEWGNNTMLNHAEFCIEAWNLGEQNGYDVPCGTFHRLFKNGEAIPSRIIDTQYGISWIILDEAWIKTLGRKFIPVGSNSRIQKNLGLYEDTVVLPVKRYVVAHCAGICSGVSFRLVPDTTPA